MELQTKVDIPTPPFSVSECCRTMFLGSCFAENMGSRMAENQFPCVVNPTGVLYNPLSIFQVLGQLQARKFDAECFLFHDGEGRWGS